MAELQEAGCVGFSQGNAALPNLSTLYNAMKYAATFGYTVWLRPEDTALADGGVAHDGEVATRLGLPPVPAIAETVALRAIIELMAATGARVHLARLSSAAASRSSPTPRRAAPRSPATWASITLHLCDRDIGDFDTNCRLTPPLRDPGDRDRLRAAVADGTIDAICSDHTPVDEDAKQVPFGEAEPGATGLELLLPLTLQWGREEKLKPAGALAAITHRAGAHTRGTLRHARRRVPQRTCAFSIPRSRGSCRRRASRASGKNTPFQGLELTGRVVRTIVGGRTVHAN
jgi:dihydroorotase